MHRECQVGIKFWPLVPQENYNLKSKSNSSTESRTVPVGLTISEPFWESNSRSSGREDKAEETNA